jgi:uncharacterized SAM-binding protein YcdF (DUF218 family)
LQPFVESSPDVSALDPSTGLRVPRAGAWRRLTGVVCAAALVAGIAGFLAFSQLIEQDEARSLRPGVAVVALTGGADRIQDALDLLEKGYAGRLLITGVNSSLTRADVARLAPRSAAFIECCVDLGYEARNTIGNALETRQWLAEHDLLGPVIVVTSNYHMPRALAELAHELPGTELIPYPVVSDRMRAGAWWNDAGVARLWVVEYLKYLVALARIQLRRPGPEPLSSQHR